jgi:hypothetical protein
LKKFSHAVSHKSTCLRRLGHRVILPPGECQSSCRIGSVRKPAAIGIVAPLHDELQRLAQDVAPFGAANIEEKLKMGTAGHLPS